MEYEEEDTDTSFEKEKQCKRSVTDHNYCIQWHIPTFWWKGPICPTPPVRDMSDYSFLGLDEVELEKKYRIDLKEKIEVERPERYIPGEIAKAGSLPRTDNTAYIQQLAGVSAPDDSTDSKFRGPSYWPSFATAQRSHYVERVYPFLKELGDAPC